MKAALGSALRLLDPQMKPNGFIKTRTNYDFAEITSEL